MGYSLLRHSYYFGGGKGLDKGVGSNSICPISKDHRSRALIQDPIRLLDLFCRSILAREDSSPMADLSAFVFLLLSY